MAKYCSLLLFRAAGLPEVPLINGRFATLAGRVIVPQFTTDASVLDFFLLAVSESNSKSNMRSSDYHKLSSSGAFSGETSATLMPINTIMPTDVLLSRLKSALFTSEKYVIVHIVNKLQYN